MTSSIYKNPFRSSDFHPNQPDLNDLANAIYFLSAPIIEGSIGELYQFYPIIATYLYPITEKENTPFLEKITQFFRSIRPHTTKDFFLFKIDRSLKVSHCALVERYLAIESPKPLSKFFEKIIALKGGKDCLTEIGKLKKSDLVKVHEEQEKTGPAYLGVAPILFYPEGNDLQVLPPEFYKKRHQRIKEIHVTENRLLYLGDEIGHFTSLKILNLSNNCLSSLPKSIGALQNLQRLHAQKNCLTSLPEEITELSSLESLHVEENLLESLPDLTKLRSLKALYAYDNLLNIPRNQLEKWEKQLDRIELEKPDREEDPKKLALKKFDKKKI